MAAHRPGVREQEHPGYGSQKDDLPGADEAQKRGRAPAPSHGVALRGPGSNQYTLKAFRAGHATELAMQGKSLGEILQAGEWRSKAFLAYVDANCVDEAQLFKELIENPDDEDPSAV